MRDHKGARFWQIVNRILLILANVGIADAMMQLASPSLPGCAPRFLLARFPSWLLLLVIFKLRYCAEPCILMVTYNQMVILMGLGVLSFKTQLSFSNSRVRALDVEGTVVA